MSASNGLSVLRIGMLRECLATARRRRLRAPLLGVAQFAFGFFASSPLVAQPLDGVLASVYSKREVRIPMRDGTRLFTTIYAPKDASLPAPILLTRTPYGVAPYGPTTLRAALGPGDNPRYAQSGFIFVYQDVRGRHQSEGSFTETTPHVASSGGGVSESTDAFDTIQWLITNQPAHNGRVAIYGISYPGFYTTASCIDPHPAVRACIPQAPIADIAAGDDLFHNGAFLLAHNFGFYLRFARAPRSPNLGVDPTYPVPAVGGDAYDFLLRQGSLSAMTKRWFPVETAPRWHVLVEHPAYDPYWQSRNITRHLNKMAPAVLVVGGWYDAEDLSGTLGTYRAIKQRAAANRLTLVMGPWSHGGWLRGAGTSLGSVSWSSHTAEYYRDSVEYPFIMHHLKDTKDPALPEVLVFRTGADVWDRLDAWPPRTTSTRSLFLQARGVSAFAPPTGRNNFSSYVSNPKRPVPSSGRIEAEGMPADYMTADQRFAAQRPDVLVFQSAVLASDLTVAGPVSPVLHVATSGTDADFIVKLIDVYPDSVLATPGTAGDRAAPGYQQLIRGEPFRARYRRGFDRSVPFVPFQPDSVRFIMPDINHTFRRGHRIMVQIQSTWFPHIDRNPQTFVPNIFKAADTDFREATMRVYHTALRRSRIDLPVVR